MPLYTFYLCGQDAQPYTFEALQQAHDNEAYRTAGRLLEQHLHAHFVAVWSGERPVLSRYRETPFLRAVFPPEARRSA